MNPEILNTTPGDLDTVCQIFDAAIMYQKKNGYPQYLTNDRILIEELIKQKRHFKIMVDKRIACTFNYDLKDKAIWQERDKKNAVYLHRIITHPDFKGLKMMQYVLDWAMQFAIKHKLKHIRCDTWDNNDSLINYYKGFGFKIIDHITSPDSDEISINCRGNKVILLQITVQ
ncbi:MAG: GNAT family N-acetyltransferase [Flavobacteriales bacterium]|nr:GNAT family N-acetyltransferase [Flavobacteriales bacterium]